MRKCTLLLCICLLAMSATAVADAPAYINYQGRLTDDAGTPIDTTVDLMFSICTDTTGTVCIWAETHTAVVVEDGLFSVTLGDVNPLDPTDYDADNFYLHIDIGGYGGTRVEPPTRLVSVPFAFHAQTVAPGAITSASIADGTIQLQDFSTFGVAEGNVLKFDGQQWTTGDCLPDGAIIMWSGSSANIPTGWVLCDGTANTPDLTDRFVYGESNDKGALSYTLAFIIKK